MNVAIVHTELLNLVSQRTSLSPRARRLLRRFGLVLLLTLPCIALADPPDWAPAHGWRKKNDPYYEGYSGRQWGDDYGVRSGSCNRAEIGAVAGAVAGGAIGSQVGKGDSRAAAIVVGAVIGATIGAEIGQRMDRTDRSCVGHALELAAPGENVSWTNPNTQVTFQLTPLGSERRENGCRKFRLIAHGTFGLSEGRTVACPDAQGVWSLAPVQQASTR
jgi:surface antigen